MHGLVVAGWKPTPQAMFVLSADFSRRSLLNMSPIYIVGFSVSSAFEWYAAVRINSPNPFIKPYTLHCHWLTLQEGTYFWLFMFSPTIAWNSNNMNFRECIVLLLNLLTTLPNFSSLASFVTEISTHYPSPLGGEWKTCPFLGPKIGI